MSFTVVQSCPGHSTGASSGAVTATFGSSVTAGNLVLIFPIANVGISETTSAPGLTWGSVGDGHNTYSQPYTHNIDVNSGVAYATYDCWLSKVSTGGTLTVTATPSVSSVLTLFAVEVSFSGGTPTISSGPNQSSGGNSMSLAAGSVTGTPNGLVFAIGNAYDGSASLSATGGYTLAQSIAGGDGIVEAAISYLANTSSSPATPAFTNTASTPWAMIGLWFQEHPATTATLSGPTSGSVGTSYEMTVTLDQPAPSGGVAVPVASTGAAGVLAATSGGSVITSITVAQFATAGTYWWTPSAAGSASITIGPTTPTLTLAGSPLSFTATSTAATAYTFTGPSGGVINVESTTFTVALNGLPTGTQTITVAISGGGLTNPEVLTFSGSTTTQTFQITPTESGTVILTPTSSPQLGDDPSILHYAVSAVPTTWGKYSTVQGFASGLLGTVGYTVYAHDGSTYAVRATAGIIAIGNSSYGALVSLPFSGGYTIEWDDGGSPVTKYAPDVVSPQVGTPTGLNHSQILNMLLAYAANKASGMQPGTGNATFFDTDGVSARIQGPYDEYGNRGLPTLTPVT